MMFNFLKICGIGILAVLLSPLWISFFAIVGVFLLVAFVFNTIKIIYFDIRNYFVKDKNNIVDPLGDLPEDYEVRRLLDAQERLNAELLASSSVQVDTSTTLNDDIDNQSSSVYLSNNVDVEEDVNNDNGGEE